MDRCVLLGILGELWAETAVRFPRGDIGRATNEELAVYIDYSGDIDALITVLVKRRLLDEIEDGRLYVHDWHDHCEDWVRHKLKAAKKTFANGAPPYKTQRTPEKKREQPANDEECREVPRSEEECGELTESDAPARAHDLSLSLSLDSPLPPEGESGGNGHKEPNPYFTALEEKYLVRTIRGDEWLQVEEQLDRWDQMGYRFNSRWFREACIDARANCKAETGKFPWTVTPLIKHLTELIGEMEPRNA